ncbi:bacillithiol biosynthesis deacetylase BshB2 [Virgibacillus sp. 179-BFC.A HS]|uniref:Bacillithiol biosynthesis deacetylase BshB2 n=1 Tax=Tigheibacillus jepli TaxID=3035914 RepID=A0ABU5CFM6_9BACI|nr:bacillithiol biosynthesis deacetylase BshB2 [Virgibacillus sp. 179-BFC.A HS]MDY0405114.1 bacillithiol biosynthesis deacetylase BshB2 [Virgibacillus sp. 179-BFC.A HS]
MKKHVVVIFPHPDDESFGVAGTISKFRAEGVPVTYLCGTLGEMGRNMGSPIIANRESMPEIRKQELINACNELDIDLQMLGYRDKTLEFEDREEVAKRLKSILEALEPHLVITHYPGHAIHPDHDALGAAAIRAIEMMDPKKRPTVWADAITTTRYEDLGKPDVVIDTSDYFDKKMAAIMAHQSQAKGILGNFKGQAPTEKDLKEVAKTALGKEEYYTWQFDN